MRNYISLHILVKSVHRSPMEEVVARAKLMQLRWHGRNNPVGAWLATLPARASGRGLGGEGGGGAGGRRRRGGVSVD